MDVKPKRHFQSHPLEWTRRQLRWTKSILKILRRLLIFICWKIAKAKMQLTTTQQPKGERKICISSAYGVKRAEFELAEASLWTTLSIADKWISAIISLTNKNVSDCRNMIKICCGCTPCWFKQVEYGCLEFCTAKRIMQWFVHFVLLQFVKLQEISF